MTTPLLTTKLYIPPVRSELVSRPRLIERLSAGLPLDLCLKTRWNVKQGALWRDSGRAVRPGLVKPLAPKRACGSALFGCWGG